MSLHRNDMLALGAFALLILFELPRASVDIERFIFLAVMGTAWVWLLRRLLRAEPIPSRDERVESARFDTPKRENRPPNEYDNDR